LGYRGVVAHAAAWDLVMKKYALVVGISRYDDPEINDLSFAAKDAEAVAASLSSHCGFDDVRTVTTDGAKEPRQENILDELHNLAPRLTPEDMFLFYFAGHGIESDRGAHLLTANSRIRSGLVEMTSISASVLSDCLSHIECSNRVLILDACRNNPRRGKGDEANVMSSRFSRDILAVAETAAEGVIPATCVLFSCKQGERAYEWPEAGHGAFTYYLLEGLGGKGVDSSGCLTVQGLGRYVESQVPRWSKKMRTERPQTPWGEQKGSWREIVLADGGTKHARRAQSSESNGIAGGNEDASRPESIAPNQVKSTRQKSETVSQDREGFDVAEAYLLEGKPHLATQYLRGQVSLHPRCLILRCVVALCSRPMMRLRNAEATEIMRQLVELRGTSEERFALVLLQVMTDCYYGKLHRRPPVHIDGLQSDSKVDVQCLDQTSRRLAELIPEVKEIMARGEK